MRKRGFPPRGKIKKRWKSAFPTLENKKSAKNGFPNIGKNKKCHWQHFPTLGKTKNLESLLSDFRGSVHFDTFSCRHYSIVHDGGHFPFHAPCTWMGLPCPGCHSTAYQECGIPLQGLSWRHTPIRVKFSMQIVLTALIFPYRQVGGMDAPVPRSP